MRHTCHWPGCLNEVPPAMWGCRRHWFRLPSHLRARIWQAYRPGQEIDKTPSAAYIAVAVEVRKWCLEQEARVRELEAGGERQVQMEKLDDAAMRFAAEYEHGEAREPTDSERAYIVDAIAGLLADDAFCAALYGAVPK